MRTTRAYVVFVRRVRSSSAHRSLTLFHGRRYISPSLSLCASRTGVPVLRNQRLRFLLIDFTLSLLSSSLFSDPVVFVSPLAPRGRCPRRGSNRLRPKRDGDARRTANQPPRPTHRPNRSNRPNRTTLSTVHYRSTATSVH